MGIEVGVIAALSLAVGVGGAVQARKQAKAGIELQEEQIAIQGASERVQLRESRRQQLREERVRRAQVLQAAENTGVGGSSGEATAISNLSTRVAGNLAFQTGQGEAANQITELGLDFAGTQEEAAKSQAVGGLGFSVFQTALRFTGTK